MIKFTKMQGLGNDYVYIDCTNRQKIEHMENLVRFLSDRHFGIGADGVIFICSSKIADFQMKMYNADGTEAGMCGNGIRCVGKYVYDNGLTQKQIVTIETKSGIKTLQLYVKEGKVFQVKVDMGTPILNAKDIPVIIDKEKDINNVRLKVFDKEFEIFCVSMGNPHAIIMVNKLDEFSVEKYGQKIEIDPHFPERTNVEFIEIIDRTHIKMRVWERGTGETLACGTGACASVVACYRNKLTKEKVIVELLGGELLVEWNRQDQHVYMTGPAKTVFKGEVEYDCD